MLLLVPLLPVAPLVPVVPVVPVPLPLLLPPPLVPELLPFIVPDPVDVLPLPLFIVSLCTDVLSVAVELELVESILDADVSPLWLPQETVKKEIARIFSLRSFII